MSPGRHRPRKIIIQTSQGPVYAWAVTPFCYALYSGGFWFRIFGYGLGFTDHRKHPPLFSERNGLRRGLHVGRYCIKVLS